MNSSAVAEEDFLQGDLGTSLWVGMRGGGGKNRWGLEPKEDFLNLQSNQHER